LGQVDVGGAIGASFGFLLTGWRRAWGILALSVIVSAALQWLGVIWTNWAASLGITLAALVVLNAATTGAMYRAVLETRHAGDPAFREHPGGLQWGGVETRVLIAGAIATLLFLVLGAVLAAICAAGFVATGQAIDPFWSQEMSAKYDTLSQAFVLITLLFTPAGLVLGALLLVGLVLLYWLGVRLMLYALSAADSGSLGLGRAWALTRGATGAVWLTWIVISLVVGGGSELASAIVGLAFQAPVGSPVASASAAAAAQVVRTALEAPLFAGLQLYVFQRRAAPPAG
jgi:hypothetical protein